MGIRCDILFGGALTWEMVRELLHTDSTIITKYSMNGIFLLMERVHLFKTGLLGYFDTLYGKVKS